MQSSESRCSAFDLSHLLQCFHLSLHLVYLVVVELRCTDKLWDRNESNVLVGEARWAEDGKEESLRLSAVSSRIFERSSGSYSELSNTADNSGEPPKPRLMIEIAANVAKWSFIIRTELLN
ncbi:unnamed protein product [Xylocopa violacea]|uniref:Uncharacterized protein n=1 Tax=Xylocopa violacea TaxID=135666 RepID=A0ABP1N9D3_XYLVO